MQYTLVLALAALVSAAPKAVPNPQPVADDLKHGSSYANSMGPVTFLYPNVRQWSEDVDNIAPCGSNAGIQNRSDFPLDDGFISFIAKYVSTSVKLSISYKSNPTNQDDFDEWYSGNVTDELHIGHTCFYTPDPPSSKKSGDNATIQAIYQNDDEDYLGDDGEPIEGTANQTFYVCADITYVEESVFDVTDYALSCFNATDDSYYEESSIDTSSASSDASQASEIAAARSSAGISSTSSSSSATATSSSSSSSQGQAAGVLSSPLTGLFGVLAVIGSSLL